MPESAFKVKAGARDWGSPLSLQPSFDSLEEALAAAREYIAEQKRAQGPSGLERVIIEETRADGSTVTHPVT